MRLAHAVLEGEATDSGMGPAYAREVVEKMHGQKMSSLPEHAKKKKRGSLAAIGARAR